MKNYWRIAAIIVLILMLVLVRRFEHSLFFDPFMAFFERTYEAGDKIPLQWYLNICLRFFLNSLISLSIIYFCFLKWSVVKFSAMLYLLVFCILFPIFFFLITRVQPDDYLAVFYVRRFLIHPVLLLVLVPALYYQKTKEGW